MIYRLILFFICLCLVPLAQGKSYSSAVLAEYQYNPLGQLIEANTPARQLRWEYDALGRVVEDWQDNYVIRHQYDNVGRKVNTQAGGLNFDYGFDKLGNFNSLSCNGSQITSIQHDVMGRETHRVLDNHLHYVQQYDPQGRLTKQQLGKADLTVNQRSYQYNEQGLISAIHDGRRGTQQFQYDKLKRLTDVQGFAPEKFIHDPAGNLLDNASQRLKGNKQTQYQGRVYQFDRQGNRVADHNGKEQNHYKYNALNQLTQVTNSKLQATYTYDALGRRTSKTVNGKTTQFYWDGDVIQREQTPETNKVYLFEPNTFRPFAFIQNGRAYYYHLDHLGTPQEITDDQGKLVWGVAYRVYGKVVSVLANEVENNLRFQGQYFDQETGLHYNRFRYYDPHCGRFINQDPIGLLGGGNLYRYVRNPVGWIDPLGLSSFDPFAVGEITNFPDDLHFGQNRISPNFSTIGSQADSRIAGRPIFDVIDELKLGALSPDVFVISYTIAPQTGKPVTLNNRGLAAIVESGKAPTNAILVSYDKVPSHLVEDIQTRQPSKSIDVTANKDGTGLIKTISSKCDLEG